MPDQRFSGSLTCKPPTTKKRFAHLFYWLVGLGMLVLLILDFASEGEVSIQLPMIFFMGILFTGPIFVVLFVIPTVWSTIYAHQQPRDSFLILWSWIHICFWLFLFNNFLYLIDAFVAFKDTIYLAWGTYAVIASCFPLFYYLLGSSRTRILLVLTLLITVVLTGFFWNPRQGEFDLPSMPTEDAIALLEATEVGDITEVRSLIQQGADIHVKDEIGFDPLHTAVFFHHYELVDYLLELGADPNTRGYKGPHSKDFSGSNSCGLILGDQPLVLTTALRLGNAPIAELLVQGGAVYSPNQSLSLSAALGDIEQLRAQLETLNASIDKPGIKTKIDGAAHVAASGPHLDALEMLLEFGAGPNSALWNASAFSRPDNVKLLLEHGADPNNWHPANGPPLMSGFNRRANQKASEIRNTIELLINAGADVNHVEEFGCRTPRDGSILIHTVRSGNITAVELLLENAADTSWRDSAGMTARDYAEVMGREDLMRLLDMHALR